jgi:hypothetical protein
LTSELMLFMPGHALTEVKREQMLKTAALKNYHCGCKRQEEIGTL